MTSDGKVFVMISGAPGNMAVLAAKTIKLQPDMHLCVDALSEVQEREIFKDGDFGLFEMVPASQHEMALRRAKADGVDMVVDFTLPRSVNQMAELYCRVGMPFVMGTTGGDRAKLVETVKGSDTYAVIATNFSIPVVVFQQMIKFAAETFPGALKDFQLLIEESHQAAKQDISGSAVGLLSYFKALGMQAGKENIIPERRPLVQELGLGIPPQFVGAHGYHKYTMRSPDGMVDLGGWHNVRARNTYADGVMRAIRFNAGHPNAKGMVFDMLDVLKWVK